jgi:hypothetical protein
VIAMPVSTPGLDRGLRSARVMVLAATWILSACAA